MDADKERINRFSNALKQSHPINEIQHMLELDPSLFHGQYNYAMLGRCSILHIAIITKNIPLVQFVIDKVNEIDSISNLLNARASKTGQTPLHVALELFSIPNVEELTRCELLVTILLDRRFTFDTVINAKDEQGLTPLHTAVLSNAPIHVVELLIHRGADINCITTKGDNVLHLCAIRNRTSLAQFFLMQIAKQSIVRENNGDVSIISLLDTNHDQLTPLHVAAKLGSEEMCALLLTFNHDVPTDQLLTAKSNDGKTPFDIAQEEGNEQCAKLLKADTSIQSPSQDWVVLDTTQETAVENAEPLSPSSSKYSISSIFDSLKNVSLPDIRQNSFLNTWQNTSLSWKDLHIPDITPLWGKQKHTHNDKRTTLTAYDLERQSIFDYVRSLGFPIEKHETMTSDGFVLQLFRIAHGNDESLKKFPEEQIDEQELIKRRNQKRPIVFLQHGVCNSGSTWVVTGIKQGLA